MRLIFYVFSIILSATTSFADPRFWQYEFPETDFQKTSLESWLEIRSGGVGKDGIPALDHVEMIAVADANIPATEPVITLELAGQAPRAYPLRYMTWHEIVNDYVGDIPFTVTFCPLCNSAIVFDRRVQGQVLDFGVTGQLRNSDMVMYDRQTFTWWQQAVGQGIVGELTGVELSVFPSWMESFADFQARNPAGVVMDEPKYSRPYGNNPYRGYDSSARPFLFNGEFPPHDIEPLARVVRVGNRAWPLSRFSGGVREIKEAGVTLTWEGEQASALDQTNIATSRKIAAIRTRDDAGNDIAHDVMFAFAFHAFWPDGVWMLEN